MSAKICRHLLTSGHVLVFEDGYNDKGFLIDGMLVWRASFPDFKDAERFVRYLGAQSVMNTASVSQCVILAGGVFIRKPKRLSLAAAL